MYAEHFENSVHYAMALNLYEVRVPEESLIKALEFSQKHKSTHPPINQTWHSILEHPWMLKDNSD